MAAVILDMEVMGVTSMSFFLRRMAGSCKVCTIAGANPLGDSDGIVTISGMKVGPSDPGPFLDVGHMHTMGLSSNPRIKDIIDEFASRLPGHLFILESKMKCAASSPEVRSMLIKLKGAAFSCGFAEVARAASECLADAGTPCDVRIEALREVVRMTLAAWSSLHSGTPDASDS